jgi:hypothetical protein
MTKIIRKGNSISYHKNWRQVTISYGWNYRNSKNAMKKHGNFNGYTVEQMQMDIPIPIQEILYWLDDKQIKKRNDFKYDIEGNQQVNFDIGAIGVFDKKGIYTVVANVENIIDMVEEASIDGHVSNVCDNGETNIVEIIRIFDINGEIIPLNEKINKLILNKLTK